MDTRALYLVSAVLLGCGAEEAPVTSATDPAPAASVVASDPAATSDPAPDPAAADPAAADPAAADPAAADPADRCEGLVGACGGWIGCVTVRVDATGPGRFVGAGPNVGHLYDENHSCLDGICNEVCSGGSGEICRPGLTERIPDLACSEAMPPSRAPFSCRMQDGACVLGPDPAMMPAS